jgi:hypothetical protein
LFFRVVTDRIDQALKMGIHLANRAIIGEEIVLLTRIQKTPLAGLCILYQGLGDSKLLNHAATVTEPFLIPHLDGKLMPHYDRVDYEEDEECKEANDHPETFVH